MQTSAISLLVMSMVAPGVRTSATGPGPGLGLALEPLFGRSALVSAPVTVDWGDACPSPRGSAVVPGNSKLQLTARGGGANSAAEAAEQARRQTGGKVLAVERTGGGYQVKVLTPAGEVRMVFIPAAGG